LQAYEEEVGKHAVVRDPKMGTQWVKDVASSQLGARAFPLVAMLYCPLPVESSGHSLT
jgi:hypothetical protein